MTLLDTWTTCCTWQHYEQVLRKLTESLLHHFLTELFLKDTKFVIRSSSEKTCFVYAHAEAARTNCVCEDVCVCFTLQEGFKESQDNLSEQLNYSTNYCEGGGRGGRGDRGQVT